MSHCAAVSAGPTCARAWIATWCKSPVSCAPWGWCTRVLPGWCMRCQMPCMGPWVGAYGSTLSAASTTITWCTNSAQASSGRIGHKQEAARCDAWALGQALLPSLSQQPRSPLSGVIAQPEHLAGRMVISKKLPDATNGALGRRIWLDSQCSLNHHHTSSARASGGQTGQRQVLEACRVPVQVQQSCLIAVLGTLML